jgi:hypothetical protein
MHMHCSQHFLPFFKMCSESHVLCRCSAPPVILPQSPQLCQSGGLFILGNRNVTGAQGQSQVSRVGGAQQPCCFVKNSLAKQCETVCCCDARASSFVARVHDKVFTHIHAVTVHHHSSVRNWLFGLPQVNSLWTMSILLTLLSTCIAFFRLGEFRLSLWEGYFVSGPQQYIQLSLPVINPG